jgi:hypothetical protein
MLINGLHIRIIHTTTGRIFREPTLNPAVDYQPWGVSPGPGQSRVEGSKCRLCRAISHCAPGRNRTYDRQIRNRP